ncbi:very short patch repair endonuclease [Paracoccus actinidiae]|uniref:very short patch repair endonuclease n=1 Tax=Paracoccus actinidiae TaxID=3064531 RepID=UPI0027D2C751|nr:very short patch repair endonuclease [Paracoccus sp. M09]
MSAIKGANTKPEILVRRALHAHGFRYRIHYRHLAGTPDIVLPKWRVAVQVHGCFWHRHHGCPKATIPANNFNFWRKKFDANVARDAKAAKSVLEQGWRLLVIWECAVGRNVQGALMDAMVSFITASPNTALRYAEIGVDHTLHEIPCQ